MENNTIPPVVTDEPVTTANTENELTLKTKVELLHSLQETIKQQTEVANNLKKELVDAMQSLDIKALQSASAIAQLNPGKKTTIVDTEQFCSLVTPVVFRQCAKVSVTQARKLVGETILDQCSTVKQGKPFISLKGI